MVVEDESDGGAGAPAGPGVPGDPAGPGTGTGTTVVDGAGAGVEAAGGLTTVVLRSHALSAATAAIMAATCMSLLFIIGTPCLIGIKERGHADSYPPLLPMHC